MTERLRGKSNEIETLLANQPEVDRRLGLEQAIGGTDESVARAVRAQCGMEYEQELRNSVPIPNDMNSPEETAGWVAAVEMASVTNDPVSYADAQPQAAKVLDAKSGQARAERAVELSTRCLGNN